MNAIILFGSPRKDGNTFRLVDALSQSLKEKGIDVRMVYLNDLNIRPCQGCLACLPEGICRINDDMKDIRKYIFESDLIIYASPVYWYGPSGQLKLAIDRSIAFFDKDYNSRVKGKKAITVMCCADEDADTFTPSIEMFKRTFNLLGITYIGGVEAPSCTDKGTIRDEFLEKAKKLAEMVP
ncbi:MAG: flavodoxin family protein [Syntrophorhabdaceae bacterium]|nr:flavodoxin family protein [Syntrophorhabdaceae bacterium]